MSEPDSLFVKMTETNDSVLGREDAEGVSSLPTPEREASEPFLDRKDAEQACSPAGPKDDEVAESGDEQNIDEDENENEEGEEEEDDEEVLEDESDDDDLVEDESNWDGKDRFSLP